LSVEPLESLRYLPWLHKDGWLVTSSTPYVNITNYPEIEDILKEIKKIKNHIIIDAETIAEQVGTKRASNMVMLGAASPFIDIPFEAFENGIRKIFGRKGDDVVDINLAALRAGREFSGRNR